MQNLLEKIKDLDIRIQVEGDNLKLNIPENLNCDSIIEEIREHKKDLINFIQMKRRGAGKVPNGIISTNETGEIPLTPAQRRLFILDRLVKDSVVYNTPLAIEIIGALDIDLFEKSIIKLIQRHEILRTQFSLDAKNMPIQAAIVDFDFKLERIEAIEAEVNTILKDFVRPFNLEAAPLLRAGLIQLSEERSVFILDIHHIIIDGVSQKIFVQELMQLYYQQELRTDILQFKDYVNWFYSTSNQNHLLGQRTFWLQELNGYKNDFKLPTDFPREKKLSFEGKSKSFNLGAQRSKQLNRLAKDSDTTLFMLLLSIYGLFLSKLTQVEDIVVGTPVANRAQLYFQRMMGMIVNTVPIRLQPKASFLFKDYLNLITYKTLTCFDNQEYNYEELIKDLDLNNDAETNPLFDVMISLNNIDDVKVDNSNLKLIPFEIDKPTAKFDLSLHFTEKAGELECVFEYRTQLYAEETISQYFGFVKNIIDQVVYNNAVCIKDISLLNQEQSTELLKLNDFSKTAYPDQATIVGLFEKRVAAAPESTALVIEDATFSYGELNTRANQIAKQLRAEGVGRDSIVGLFMAKSFDLIAGMLGILKAGGAYLPIDLTYPASRIEYIIKNSGAKLMLSNKSSVHRLEEFVISKILVEDISTEETPNLQHINAPNDLAYIIYTSGTTGKPKGVMVEHRNLVRLFFADGFQFDFSNQDTWIMFHSASFDVSVWEMYGALLFGAKLVIIDPETARNAYKFKNIVKKQKVTVLTQTPTGFYNFIRVSNLKDDTTFPDLKYVIFCGEELTPAKLLEWHQVNPHVDLINMYGITETTVHVTFKKLIEQDMLQNESNIGRPIPTISMYVLDKNLNVVPQGSIGEIYVGGEGVARGYLNKPELTAERFISSPFEENEILYKSGDLARILSNGDMEYLGRNDRQVQIKGFRIELGEIEYQLAKNEAVKQAVVVAQKDEKYPWICAYVVMDSDIAEEELREFLSCHVPYYMVPNYIVKIDEIPYTSNFKVDYKKLPAPTQNKSSNYVAPGNEQQKIMSKIWAEHLSTSKVGIKDNFFGLGGDSIRALSVTSDMNEALKSSIEIVDIYEHPTIEELCHYLLQKPTSDWVNLKNQAEKELENFQANYQANFPFEDNYEAVYPMNGVEKGMVFHSLGRSDKSESLHDIIYHEQNIYLFPGAGFDFELFKVCVDRLVKNHSTLRKIYDLENLAHIVLKEVDPEINFIDISNLKSKDQEVFIAKKMEEEKLKQTELNRSLFWRMNIIKVSPVHHYLLFDFHHSLFDGWSLSAFLSELRDTYLKNASGQESFPQPLQTTYRDQVITEIAARLNEKSKDYWKTELKGFERLKMHDTGLDHEYKTHYYDLGKSFRKKMERVAHRNHSNLKHLCFAAYLYMMKMYTGMNDLTVGLVSNNRPTTKDGEKLLGCFLNTIPFRAQVEHDITWREFINYIEAKLINLKRHDKIPLNEIINLIDEPTNTDNPIFQTCFNYIDFHVLGESIKSPTIDEDGSGFGFQNSVNSDTIFDVTITAHNSTFTFVLNHSTAIINDVISAQLFEYFRRVLYKLLDQLDTKVVQNDILTNSDKAYLLGTELNPERGHQPITPIIKKFEEQVKRTPTKVALTCGSRELSYAQLDQQSKRLAHYLKNEKNIEAGDFVGIKMDRSEWQIIALLSILQTRACYVPIDPAYPDQRVKYIEEDCQCKEIIDAAWMESFLDLDYDQELKDLDYQMSDNVYMIYTSGSTGMPKGVPINNSNIGNYAEWGMEYYRGNLAQYNFPYFTSLSFDISQPIILLTLFSGGKLFIYPGEDLNETMKDIMANDEVNSIFLTPSHLQIIGENTIAPHISNFILGGEALLPSHISKVEKCAPEARIFNAYGPTESTVGCTSAEIIRGEERTFIPIGKPINNTKIYILDHENQLIPPGVVGELCVSGEGVAHGYWNRPELSRKKFINDPYAEDSERRMYKTGDLARWATNGQLEIIGRKDDQVQIRGYRVELEEIISCIDKHETVAQSVVLARQDHQGNNILVGFVVPKSAAFDKGQLKQYLRAELPHYMVPGVLLELDKLPLNQSGKIDRKSLMQLDLSSSLEEKVAPRNETESGMLEIWREVLQMDAVGVHDNFFELGGHSVSAIVLINKIQRTFNVKVPLHELFNHSSLATLAEYIANSTQDNAIDIATAPVREFYPLSSVQKRQYFMYELYPDTLSYNIPVVLSIDGQLDLSRLERVINQLTERHTILRSGFKLHNEQPVQWIRENVKQELVLTTCLESEINDQINAFVRPFNLAEELPIRFSVLKISDNKHVLLLDMHHIIFDEGSRDIILKEMMDLYQGADLPQPRLEYKDYAVWQEGDYYRNMVSEHKNFWLDIYADSTPVLELPTDYPRPATLNGRAHVSSITLEKSLSDQIRNVARKEGTSVFNFMMAAYNIFLSKLSNQDDIAVGISTSGRQHADLEDVVGMFTNTLALRNQPQEDITFQEFLTKLHNNTVSAFDHRFYPYDDLVDTLKAPRLTNRNPLFDVFMIYSQKIDEALFTYQDFTIRPYEMPFDAAKFDLTLTVLDSPEEIELSVIGHQDLFKLSSVERFAAYLKQIIKDAASDPGQLIEDIDLLSKEEKMRLLSFNQGSVILEKSIVEQFSEQVKNTPNRKAVVFQGKALSYLELDNQAKRLANYLLVEKHIKTGDFVGIQLQRSEWSVIAMLGVLYARASYVPVDPEYPEDRINYIKSDSQCKETIDNSWIEAFVKEEAKYSTELDNLNYEMADNVYMIYTSGSTGKPKGVAINNQNLDNYIGWAMEYYQGDLEYFSFPLMTSLSFDLTQTAVLLTLLSGGELSIYNDDVMTTMKAVLSNPAVNSLKLTPSHLHLIEDGLSSQVTNFIVGGEALLPGHVKKIKSSAPQSRVFNEYGPTEATIGCTCAEVVDCEEGKFITIGRPIANTNVYILNHQDQLVPPGIVGELCVSGEGVAHGYFNRPELTRQKFRKDQYSNEKGRRMYKTGDLARWTDEGTLELFGRKDDQVKVRGYRIELGEITATIDKYEKIAQNIVLAKKDALGNNTLIAYIVPLAADFDLEQFQQYLKDTLPFYSIPNVVIELDKLPLTQNGKIDKEALLKKEITSNKTFEAPRNELESSLSEIWKDVLKVDALSIHDNFFELGGHSLLAIILVNKIQSAFHVKVPLQELFNNSSLATLAHFISTSDKEENIVITPAPVQEYYPLSSVQKRQFIIYQLYPDALLYNIPVILKIKGQLGLTKLEEVINELSERHSILRTSFKVLDGNPVQWIRENVKPDLEIISCLDAELDDQVKAFVRPFDLAEELPIRFKVLKVSDDHHLLMLDMHHIISDEVSQDIILKEMMELYQGSELPQPMLQYKDYVVWQEGEYYRNLVAEHKNFWLEVYTELTPALELPTDYTRPVELKDRAYVSTITLEKTLCDEIRNIVRKEGTSVFNFMMATYNIFLSKLSNQNDIAVGISTSGRQHADLEDVVGMFTNTLALRNQPKGEHTFQEFLKTLHDNTLKAFDHRFYPYEDLVDALQIPRIVNRNPLFDVFMVYGQKIDNALFNGSDLAIEPFQTPFNAAKFDLTLTVSEAPDEIELSMIGHQDLFKSSSVERFTTYLKQIIKEVSADPARRIKDINLLSPEEKQQLLSFNQETEGIEKSITEIFSVQVKKTPENKALVFQGKTLTYQELDEQSNQLARYLLAKDIGKGDMIGLFIDRSMEMMIGILAILKTGAAYVPIDPEFPDTRVEFILEDASIKWALTAPKYQLSLLEKGCGPIPLESIWTEVLSYSAEAIDIDVKPEDLMYVIYTSGSTGRPKGVMLEHRSLANLSADQIQRFKVSEEDRILQFTSITFDVSVSEIMMALFSGATLVLVEKEVIYGGESLIDYMQEQEVSIFSLPPAYLKVLNKDRLKFLRCIITAGEAANVEDAQYLCEQVAYFNAYGPTECSVYTSAYQVDPQLTYVHQIPIGEPLNNLKTYILDQDDQLCPIGVIGELCVSGVGVARGYLNRRELTEEKFITCPLDASERMYRTGDYAKWDKDGNLEFIGRRDDQVKIRGFRIELGEIEATLDKCGLVKQATVQVIEKGKGNKNIVAYIVPEGAFDAQAIHMHLASKLPGYMKPAYLIELESIPLTSHGKVDRKSLPHPDQIEREYTAPATATEEQLVLIWSEILQLGADKISANDRFFELGGNSLKAILLINKISKHLSVTTTLRSVFQFQDVKSLAEHIDGLEKVAFVAMPKAPESDYYPLSSAQQRMYFLYQLDKGGTSYNIPMMFKIGDKLDVGQLEYTLKALVERHQSLRTLYELNDGQPVQRVAEANAFSIDHLEVSTAELELKMMEFIRPFDLSKQLPFRATIIDTDGQPCILMMDMHHIAGDGVSTEILMRDIRSLYMGDNLEDLELQYVDYSVWQHGEAYQALVANHKQYWLDVYSEEVVALELPTDHTRQPVLSNEAYEYTGILSEELSKGLFALARQEGVTMYTLLLGIYKVFLNKLSNEKDIVVGTPTAGRHHSDTEGIVGMFVNTLALRNVVDPELSFKEFLAQVQDQTVSAFDHQLYQYEDLVDTLEVPRNINRNPLFDVFYAYNQGEVGLGGRSSELDLTPHDIGYTISKFDLSLDVIESETLNILIKGRKDLFEPPTIERFMMYLTRLIEQVLSRPAQQLKELDILSKDEKNQLLKEYNDTSVTYDPAKTVLDRFTEQVSKTPEAAALIFDEKVISYEELDTRSTQWAHSLIQKGVKKGESVGLLMNRSTELITAMLAVMKAGASYLPLNTEQPLSRTLYMLEDTESSLIISNVDQIPEQLSSSCKCLTAELLDNDKTVTAEKALDLPATQDLAYIMYTSGTTGKPKGVMIEHSALIDYANTFQNYFKLTNKDRVLHQSSISFDTSVEEIFPVLISGGKLVIMPQGMDLDDLFKTCEKSQITLLSGAPFVLDFLNDNYSKYTLSLRVIISGGDSLKKNHISNIYELFDIYNTYGPTESTVCASFYKMDNLSNNIPIGKPISNRVIHILNEAKQLVPKGVAGELFIGGKGLSRGYLNLPDLSSERFIKNPFGEGRLYKTGDLAKWLPDGNIEFMGRADHQVKLNGVRIELGEIESHLNAVKGITDCVLMLREIRGNNALVAYYVAERSIAESAIRMNLLDSLPMSMVPGYYLQMDALPLTTSGKLDRRSLPLPEASKLEYKAPSTSTEEQLVEIWSEILQMEANEISVNANFFSLGGHSLVLVKMMHLIRKAFATEISIDRIYRYSTIEEIAKMIDDRMVIGGLADNSTVLLKEHDKAKGNAFFIHDGSGNVHGYMKIVQSMKKYNCYGLAFEDLGSAIENIGMDEIVSMYIDRMKNIQQDGPYLIVGWSSGGVLSYEIARKLESQGEELEKVVLIDTHFNFDKNLPKTALSVASEVELINSWTKNGLKLNTAEMTSVGALWDAVFESPEFALLTPAELSSSLPPDVKEMIGFMDQMTTREMLTAYNKIRYVSGIVDAHSLSSAIQAKVKYIRASEQGRTAEKLAEYFTDFSAIEAQGTHFSIMENDSVRLIAQMIES